MTADYIQRISKPWPTAPAPLWAITARSPLPRLWRVFRFAVLLSRRGSACTSQRLCWGACMSSRQGFNAVQTIATWCCNT